MISKTTFKISLTIAVFLLVSACVKDDIKNTNPTDKNLTREQRLDSIVHSKRGLAPFLLLDSVEIVGTNGLIIFDTIFKRTAKNVFNINDFYFWCDVLTETDYSNPNFGKPAIYQIMQRYVTIHAKDKNGLIGRFQKDTILKLAFFEKTRVSKYFGNIDEAKETLNRWSTYSKIDDNESVRIYDSAVQTFSNQNLPYSDDLKRELLCCTFVSEFDLIYKDDFRDFFGWLNEPTQGLWPRFQSEYLFKLDQLWIGFKAGNQDSISLSSLNFKNFRKPLPEFSVKNEILTDQQNHRVLYLKIPFYDCYWEKRFMWLRYVLD